MKPQELNITTPELDRLCQMYLDCELTVIEEKELELLLTHTDLTSPIIAEVRELMNVQALITPRVTKAPEATIFPRPVRRPWRWISGVAAAVAAVIAVSVYVTTVTSPASATEATYLAVYSHGHRLSGDEARIAAEAAMAKADSLMHYAALAERESMAKAERLISETINN